MLFCTTNIVEDYDDYDEMSGSGAGDDDHMYEYDYEIDHDFESSADYFDSYGEDLG